jgi:hypothetical protein
MQTLTELILGFKRIDMFDADKRRRYEIALGDLVDVLAQMGIHSTKETNDIEMYPAIQLAEKGVDKYALYGEFH